MNILVVQILKYLYIYLKKLMKKNLIFLNVDALDAARSKFVDPLISKLDEGSIFKSFIILILQITAFAALIGGLVLTVTGLLGDDSFVTRNITNEFKDGAHITGSTIGLVVGVALSLIIAWLLYAIIMKRTTQLDSEEYDGLLNYVFSKVAPKLIILAGEVACTLMIYVSLLAIIATCVGAAAYGPLQEYPGIIVGLFPGMEMIPNQRMDLVGNYDFFEEGMKSGILGLVFSFISLIGFYIYREVYYYALKLVKALIEYLPKFAIPFSIRNRNEN